MVVVSAEGILHLVVPHGQLGVKLLAIKMCDLHLDCLVHGPDISRLQVVVRDLVWEFRAGDAAIDTTVQLDFDVIAERLLDRHWNDHAILQRGRGLSSHHGESLV